MDTTTATPAQIDGRLAFIQTEMARLEHAKARSQSLLDEFAAADGYQLNYSRFSEGNLDAARVAIAAADEARQALIAEATVLNEEFSSRGGWTRFDIAGNLSRLCWRGTGHPSSPEWMNNVEVARAALADRGEAYDYDKALVNARKKIAREGGEPKF